MSFIAVCGSEKEQELNKMRFSNDTLTVQIFSYFLFTHNRWRVATVFISSTFLDMHGERDILTRFVFPEIRQWARKRLVNVVDIDLRWGVPQHATKNTG